MTWAPGNSAAIPGELAFDGNEASLTLKSNQQSCVTVGDDMTGDPLTQSASAHDEHWIGVGCAPGPGPRATVRLTSPDRILFVLERRPG